jgi:hypothetical protein
MCDLVVPDKSVNDDSFDQSFSANIWNGITFEQVQASLMDPLGPSKFLLCQDLHVRVQELGRTGESKAVLLPSPGLIKALLAIAPHPPDGQYSVKECTKLLKTKTGQHDQPSWFRTFQQLLQSHPAGEALTDFDTWVDWMVNGFIVLVQITDVHQIDR